MITIKASEIKDEHEVCPYCGDVNNGRRMSCCGEVHFETGYEMNDGTIYLESEVTILEDA